MSEKYNWSEEVKIETGKQYNFSYPEFLLLILGSKTGKQYNSSYQEARFWNNQQLSLCSNWGVSRLGSESWDALSAKQQSISFWEGCNVLAGRWNFESGIVHWCAPPPSPVCEYQILLYLCPYLSLHLYLYMFLFCIRGMFYWRGAPHPPRELGCKYEIFSALRSHGSMWLPSSI